jgi:hypothetical protein
LESRIALSSSGLSSFLGSLFPGLISTSTHTSTPHTLAYYEKLAPTNAHAAQIVQRVEANRAKAAELRAERAAHHAHA